MQINSSERAIKSPPTLDPKALQGLGNLAKIPKEILDEIWNQLSLPEQINFAWASKWIRHEFLLNGPLLRSTLTKINSVAFPKDKEIVPTPYLHILAKGAPGPYKLLHYRNQTLGSPLLKDESKLKYTVTFSFEYSIFDKKTFDRCIKIEKKDRSFVEFPLKIKDEPLATQSFFHTELPCDGKLLLVGSKPGDDRNPDLKSVCTFTIYLISFDFETESGECQEITRIALTPKIKKYSDHVQIIPLGQEHNAILNLGGHLYSLIGNHLWQVLGPEISGSGSYCTGFLKNDQSGKWFGIFGEGQSPPSKGLIKEYSFPKAIFSDLKSPRSSVVNQTDSSGWWSLTKISSKVMAALGFQAQD